MAKYKFKGSFTASGTNYFTPSANAKYAIIKLRKDFKKGEVVEGGFTTINRQVYCVASPCPSFKEKALTVITDGAAYDSGVPSPYSGKGVFNIPLSVLEGAESRIIEMGHDNRPPSGNTGDSPSGNTERAAEKKDNTIYYVVGGIILAGAIAYVVFGRNSRRKPMN